MPPREQVHYFGPGPARLPTSVFTRTSHSILNHNNTGLGLVEHSHRPTLANSILQSATDSFKALLNVPAGYTPIFMQGGGITQLSSVVYNLLSYWVEKRVRKYNRDLEKVQRLGECKEAARLLGDDKVSVVAGAKKANEGKWGVIPDEKDWKLEETANSILTYFCDNEAVDGVEFPGFPEVLKAGAEENPEGEERLVVGDMTSNILSRPVDVKKFAIIFAGAQKNIGMTGLTLVLVRDSILNCQPTHATLRALGLPIPPIMMHYPTIAKSNSLYNTLPIFDVYVAGEVMTEQLAAGGIPAIPASASKKSSVIYDIIGQNPNVYSAVVTDKLFRSRMNVCFRIAKGKDGHDLERDFFSGAEQRGLTGIKRHWSVGGARVSCYNSIMEDEVQLLASYMKEFAAKQDHTYLPLD